ncbi:cytochrome C oxidase subunit II [Paenibacillus rhizovicinus]|uniref:Cytochrome C oxidase subunit II n=1 Tax=Paenibacillus rhizovicinus TaxID=2704463 RepID=A0A6C0NV21_9BACL|nr:cupredoxin domain-containing protein [Paenibacillus rhizovicinus]QHW29593.1 cytochrome C oxidase subunit II [Paenibacillus rhizovicinus]
MKLTIAKLCLFALIALLGLSACGKSSNNTNNNAPSNQTPAAGGATKEITVNAVDWSYSEPEIKANVGDTLKITLHNEKGVHGLQSEDLGVDLKDGETATVKLDKAGTYEFHCNIQCGQGHDNMVGQIIVQ